MLACPSDRAARRPPIGAPDDAGAVAGRGDRSAVALAPRKRETWFASTDRACGYHSVSSMSIAPLGPCQNCKSALVVEFIARMSASDESNYGVSWICPTCKSRALDVCPVGPVIPTANGCLNCGSPLDVHARCSGCGMRDATMLAWFGIGDGAPLDAANRDLSRGLIRRALGRINHLLRDDASAVDAWRFKARAYDQLGFHATAARMLRHAAEVTRTP